MTSGQDMECVCSYNPRAHTGQYQARKLGLFFTDAWSPYGGFSECHFTSQLNITFQLSNSNHAINYMHCNARHKTGQVLY